MDVLILIQGMVPEPGRAVTGNGLRALALMRGLGARGHRVRLLTRSVDAPADDRAADVLVYDAPGEVADIVRASGADAVIVCHWDLLEALEDPSPVPVVVDLYGPRLVETQFESTELDREAVRFVETLRRGDCFLVATERQRWFALPWLMLAGFDCRQLPVHVVPLSADPDLPRPRPDKEPRIVSGGVFWPWRECEAGLAAVLEALDKAKRGTLELFGGSYPLATEAKVAYRDPRDRLPESDRLAFRGMVPYDELLASYRGAWAAFDVMARNAERELSFSFRVIDYLACGVPVVTNDFTEIASEIEAHEAGWLVNLEEPGGIASVVREILENPKEARRRGRNAQRLARERYSWERAVEPLERSLASLGRAARKPSLLGTIISVSNDAYRAREERLDEIERSRKAVRRAEELDEQLGRLRQEEAELAGKLTWARSELEARTQELEQAKERVRAMTREHSAKLEERTAEREAIRAEVARREDRIRELEEAREQAKRETGVLAERIHSLEAQIRNGAQVERELEAAAERARGERDQARDRIETLKGDVSTAHEASKALRARLSSVEEELRTARGEIAHRTVERDRALQEAARLESARTGDAAQRDGLAQRLELATRERDALEGKLASTEKRLEARGTEVEELAREVATLRGVIDRRAAEVERKHAELEAVREELGDAEQKIHDATRRAAELADRLAERDEQLRAAKDAIGDALRERDRHRGEGEELRGRLERARAELHAAGTRLHERETQLTELGDRQAATRMELEETRQHLARESGEVERWKHEVTTREQAIQHWRAESEKRDVRIHDLTEARAALEAEVEHVRAAQERVAHELSQARADLASRAEVIGARDAEIERLAEHKRSLEVQLSDAAGERERIVSELNELRASFPVRLWAKLTRKG